MIHKTTFRTRYGNRPNGHHISSNYYIYFELGRTEFLREAGGMSYKEMEGLGLMLPMVKLDANIKFLQNMMMN